MKYSLVIVLGALMLLLMAGCKEGQKQGSSKEKSSNEKASEEPIEPQMIILTEAPENIQTPKGMVWIPGASFLQGAVSHDKMAMGHEKPAIPVMVNGFFMDISEVTNGDYQKFVDATGYMTVAEREIDWEEMKKQVPPGTPRPHDSIMKPGSLTFKKNKVSVPNLYDFSQWWQWTIGANWKHPSGPSSDIRGKENHPVVHIAYEDALAYCEWAGRRLPTEAEWERAARGNQEARLFTWGDDSAILFKMANTWEGEFPVNNTQIDGFEFRAEVKSYPPNDFGLYDMAGNVWEWTNDWYNTNYYKEMKAGGKVVGDPQGADRPFNEGNPYAQERVIKGGSFLCSASYCASYRISARMATSLDSSQEHLGFRTVATVEMLAK
ncbi:MAG: formylglycine-generating enzyme family protein [Flavobacteriaceae bacterium]